MDTEAASEMNVCNGLTSQRASERVIGIMHSTYFLCLFSYIHVKSSRFYFCRTVAEAAQLTAAEERACKPSRQEEEEGFQDRQTDMQ